MIDQAGDADAVRAAASEAGPLLTAAAALSLDLIKEGQSAERAIAAAAGQRVQDELNGLQVIHFPLLLPEVFLRARPGFDVLVSHPLSERIGESFKKVAGSSFYRLQPPGTRHNYARLSAERFMSLVRPGG